MNFKRSEALLMGVLVVLLPVALAAYRTASGAGFGLLPQDPQGRMVPLGILGFTHDNLQYASWAQQAKEGRLLFEDRFTLQPHPRAFFNPTFLLAGRLARWWSVPAHAVLAIGGVFCLGVAVYTVYLVGLMLGLDRNAVHCGVAVAAFSGGFSGLYPDAFLLQCALTTPFVSIAYALLGALLVLVVLLERFADDRWVAVTAAGCLFLIVLVLGTTHPYEYLLATSTYGLYVALVTATRNDARSPRRWLILLVLVAASAIVLTYHTWLRSQPVWKEAAKTSLHLPRGRGFWLRECGALWTTALLGCWILRKEISKTPLVWFALWTACVAVALVILGIPQTKVIAGSHLPISVLAGVGLYRLHLVATSEGVRWRRAALGALVLILALGMLLGPAMQLVVYFDPGYEVDGNLLLVIREFDAASSESVPRVLCSAEVARVICAYGRARVYCGNQYKTPRYEEKLQLLKLAGFDYPDSDAPSSSQDRAHALENRQATLRELLGQIDVEYVLVERSTPAFQALKSMQEVGPSLTVGNWQLYPVR